MFSAMFLKSYQIHCDSTNQIFTVSYFSLKMFWRGANSNCSSLNATLKSTSTKNCIFYAHLHNMVLPIVHNLCLYQYSPTPTSLTVYQQDNLLSKSFPIALLHTHYLSLSSSPSLMLFYWRVLHFQVSNNSLFCIKQRQGQTLKRNPSSNPDFFAFGYPAIYLDIQHLK